MCIRDRLNQPVYGCLIALSGVNGNVAGSFDHLKQCHSEIDLISGEDLLAALNRSFSLENESAIRGKVERQTNRRVTKIDISFYDEILYWICELDGDYFCIVPAGKNPVASSTFAAFRTLVEPETTRSFLNIGDACDLVEIVRSDEIQLNFAELVSHSLPLNNDDKIRHALFVNGIEHSIVIAMNDKADSQVIACNVLKLNDNGSMTALILFDRSVPSLAICRQKEILVNQYVSVLRGILKGGHASSVSGNIELLAFTELHFSGRRTIWQDPPLVRMEISWASQLLLVPEQAIYELLGQDNLDIAKLLEQVKNDQEAAASVIRGIAETLERNTSTRRQLVEQRIVDMLFAYSYGVEISEVGFDSILT